jgi:hypothetical protein
VSENRVLRRIFQPREEEVDTGRRRMHNEELQIKQDEMVEACNRQGKDGKCIQNLGRKA